MLKDINKKKHVIMLINSLEGGGAERVFSILVNKSMQDFHITVIVLDDRPIMHPIHEDVQFICFGSKLKGVSFLKFIFCIRTMKPDIVVSFLSRSNYFNVLSRLFSFHVIMINERSTPSGRFASKDAYGIFNRWLIRFLYPFADKIIANSQGGARDLIDNFLVPAKKTITLHNPFDIAEVISKGSIPLAVDEEYVCAVGRLDEAKRFDLLIRAYASSNITPKLYILGQGPLRLDLEKLIHSLNIQGKVKLLGYQRNPYNYIKHCKFYILSSQREGFPNGLTEAMILKKAVIATDCKSGPREILDPAFTGKIKDIHWGKYGLLIPKNDEIILSKALQQMENKEEKRQAYEKQSFVRANDFHVDHIYQSYKLILLGIR